MRYTTHLSSLHHGDVHIQVTDGVVDIADEHMPLFVDLIACGWLIPAPVELVTEVPAPEPEPEPPEKTDEPKAEEAVAPAPEPEPEEPTPPPARKRGKAKDGE